MTTIDRCPILDGAGSLEQAAKIVTQGSAMFSPDHLAGQYAFVAAAQAGFGFETDTLEAHLEILRDAGAEFDTPAAIIVARQFAAQGD